jgi:hypothetical protein
VLNALFNQLFQKASNTQYFDHYDRYMRFAFKAQAQCRATFETLARSKNPPVFARQANIAQGTQQINNTMSIARAGLPKPRRTNYGKPMATGWSEERRLRQSEAVQ